MTQTTRPSLGIAFAAAIAALLLASTAAAHGVAEEDAQFLERISGFHFAPFLYLGA